MRGTVKHTWFLLPVLLDAFIAEKIDEELLDQARKIAGKKKLLLIMYRKHPELKDEGMYAICASITCRKDAMKLCHQ